jgi:hypothetical protein
MRLPVTGILGIKAETDNKSSGRRGRIGQEAADEKQRRVTDSSRRLHHLQASETEMSEEPDERGTT